MATTFRGPRGEFVRLLHTLAAALAGREPDRYGVVERCLTAGGVALLGRVQEAFVAKSRGGTGSDGIQWPPLKPETVARRRTSRAELKALGIGGGRGLGTLTDAQRKQWRVSYRKALAGLRARGAPDAESRATGIAWGVLGRSGVKTRRQVLAGRSVQILVDTAGLLQSLTPGYEASPSGAAGQVFEVKPGAVTVGTSVKPWHHAGVPGRLPARPLWRTDGTLPDEHAKAVADAIGRALAAAVALAATRS